MLTEIRTAEVRARIQRWRNIHQRIAFVPTLGNLHAGHIALVKHARTLAERVVVSIFVNPLQFGPNEDYQSYPRTLEADRLQLAVAGADMLFTPDLEEMYPEGMDEVTRVEVPHLSGILCGAFRPGHFAGVTTVVAKLFNMVQPDVAVFGDKDYQQQVIIRRMVRDLCMPIEIVGVPTVRELDGLAMSSRNQYLSKSERALAPALQRNLREVAFALRDGSRDFAKLQQAAMDRLKGEGLRPEYVEVRRADTLEAPAEDDTRYVVLAAAWLGKTRLIDNVVMDVRAPEERTVVLSRPEAVG